MTRRAMPIDKEIGTRIREARKMGDRTMAWLGSAVGVSEQAISQYELGKRPVQIELATAIANALDVDAKYLLYGEPRKLVLTTPDGRREEFDGYPEEWQGSAGVTQERGEGDSFDAVVQAIEDYWNAEDAYKRDSSTSSTWIASLKRLDKVAQESKMPQQVFDKLWDDAAQRHGGIVIKGNRYIAYPKEGSATDPAIFDTLSGKTPRPE